MNGVGLDRLVKVLHKARKHHCAYFGVSNCDCKFSLGEQDLIRLQEMGNGCPELRQAIILLEQLTPAEYLNLCRRAGIELIPDADLVTVPKK